MKTFMFIFAALGMLVAGSLRPRPVKEKDDDVGLFVGSARPLPANARRRPSAKATGSKSRAR
jgi:hypothetical protein